MSYYYLIESNNGEILHFEDAGEVAQYIIENADLSDAYDEYLDCDGAVDVAGLSFYPSTIIKSATPSHIIADTPILQTHFMTT